MNLEADIWMALGLLAAGLLLAGLSAAAEVVLPGVRLRRGPGGERQADQEWAARHRSSLGLTVLGMTAIGAMLTGGALTAALYPSVPWMEPAIVALVAGVLVLVAQALPSAVAAAAPEQALRIIRLPLGLFLALMTPFAALHRLLATIAARRLSTGEIAVSLQQQERESIADEIAEQGAALEEEERQMIRAIIGMESTPVRAIMVPRMDIVAAEADAPLEEAIALIRQHGYSRIPIYDETLDNIVGVVYAKDLLQQLAAGGRQPSLRALARPPYFVPESKRIHELLHEFRNMRRHVAIVVDEYGGTAGLVTLEDMIEEIVGDISDEYERGERVAKPVVRLSEDEAELDARVSIDDLNELFHTDIEHNGYESVGGLVYAQLGKIPNVGDEVQVDGLTISVVSTIGRRIKKVRALHRSAGEDEQDSGT